MYLQHWRVSENLFLHRDWFFASRLSGIPASPSGNPRQPFPD
jgi:hypothetical protein